MKTSTIILLGMGAIHILELIIIGESSLWKMGYMTLSNILIAISGILIGGLTWKDD